MIISATDFQLRVNEYFMKLIQGEEVVIERYGKKFAVLLPYEKYTQNSKDLEDYSSQGNVTSDDLPLKVEEEQSVADQKILTANLTVEKTEEKSDTLTAAETTKLLKMLLAKIS